jgi:putative membrane protein
MIALATAPIQWWCSAQGIAWAWTWRAYPGVWLFIALLAVGYARADRAAKMGKAEERFSPRTRRLLFVGGLLLVWGALDWPIGTLGAGYLASLHQVQLLLLAYTAPALLLLSLPFSWLRHLEGHPRVLGVLRAVTRPLVAAVLFAGIILTTHLPWVVDGLMATQLGSFAFDFSWLLAGLLLWWPIACPIPRRPGFRGPLPLLYLFVATIPMILPAAFMTYAAYPLFSVYEFAPRVHWIPAVSDQRVAGLLMWIVGSLIFVVGMAVLFFRWAREEEQVSGPPATERERRGATAGAGGGADPEPISLTRGR